jgi:hypothetical protein
MYLYALFFFFFPLFVGRAFCSFHPPLSFRLFVIIVVYACPRKTFRFICNVGGRLPWLSLYLSFSLSFSFSSMFFRVLLLLFVEGWFSL